MQLNQIGTQRLETERLILRRFCIEDAREMHENYANDDNVTKYLTWSTHSSIEVTKEILEAWVKNYQNEWFYSWAIVSKETAQVIGSISMKVTPERFRGEIGYVIGRKFWNKGIMTEALKEILIYGFEKIELKRIQACHHSDNQSSGKVMLKAGMQYEGRLRNWSFNNKGLLVDCEMYSKIMC